MVMESSILKITDLGFRNISVITVLKWPGCPQADHPYSSVLDLIMIAPTQLQIVQCIFSYTCILFLANLEGEPHAPNTYQSKLVPSGSTNPQTQIQGQFDPERLTCAVFP